MLVERKGNIYKSALGAISPFYAYAVFASIQYILSSVNMETCFDGMSTRVKLRAVIQFLTVEKVTHTEIHRRIQGVYGDGAVDRSVDGTKFCGCETGKDSLEKPEI